MSFDDADKKADQEFDLQHDRDGIIEYQTKLVKFYDIVSMPRSHFSMCTKLTFFILLVL